MSQDQESVKSSDFKLKVFQEVLKDETDQKRHGVKDLKVISDNFIQITNNLPAISGRNLRCRSNKMDALIPYQSKMDKTEDKYVHVCIFNKVQIHLLILLLLTFFP